MTADLRPAEEPEDDDVDVDLDIISETLRKERVGKPTTVRVDGVVIRIINAADWSSTAMSAASSGNWPTWAREVIPDNEEYQAWAAADLHNFQIEAVFQQCGMSMGKSRGPSGTRKRSRKR
jgi:hypothetical protein